MIGTAVKEHGYSQVEVARHLKLHYSTISRLLKEQRQRPDRRWDLAPMSAINRAGLTHFMSARYFMGYQLLSKKLLVTSGDELAEVAL
jgi:hypothetical protein